MNRSKLLALTGLLFLAPMFLAPTAFAGIYGAVRGVVHDPQHRPIQNAMVMLRAKSSDWAKSVTTDASGEFQLNGVPLGDYSVSVASQGFAQASQLVIVNSGSEPVVHFQLKVASANEKVTVSGEAEVAPTDSATPTTLVSRLDIDRTPGADRTNSMAMITDFVPGSYVTHDQLHIRGGHQTSWLVDGVPVPNTNIASNIGPQFDPKDIDYLEVNRGSYGAEFGDRTYGVFNVVPRTGFERNNEAELVLSAGNFYQTNDHSALAATPAPRLLRERQWEPQRSRNPDAGSGRSCMTRRTDTEGFGSLIFNVDPSNQLRLVTSAARTITRFPTIHFQMILRTLVDLQRMILNGQYPSHWPARRRPRIGRAGEFLVGAHLQFANVAHHFAVLSSQRREL